jgi:uncharacterized protein YdeI (YjbR/CyaY-like superfamily)
MLKMLTFTNRDEWRDWLAGHHASETEVWLIYFKKHTAKPSIPYDHAVQEALCFGWIDSTVKTIDDQRYAQKFTPRRDCTKWSPSNLKRIRTLIHEGQMTKAGLAKIDVKLLDERPAAKQATKKRDPTLPRALRQALIANPKAWKYFNTLAPSYRSLYVRWILAAKKAETRERRLREAVLLLQQNKKLGLK